MTKVSAIKILFVQRVIANYRLDLLKLLCEDFKEVGIITSQGDNEGTLKVANYKNALNEYKNLKIYELNAFKIKYKGESRSTILFLYPKAIKIIKQYDVIIFEGTTNLINNVFLVPYAKILRKKTVWWDAGYSLNKRTFKRKLIDSVVSFFIKMTNMQMAYSTKAGEYMQDFMGAKKVFVNLNTINTRYYLNIQEEINDSISYYQFNRNVIRLLYVGVVESRKKVIDLINIVIELNKYTDRNFKLTIIGGGNQLEKLQNHLKGNDKIKITGPIYDKDVLKGYYFNSDLFVLPGDGGLAILQSLLYGLPVICVKGADGTELDYIKDSRMLANTVKEIKEKLLGLDNIDRKELLSKTYYIDDIEWRRNLINKVLLQF